MKKKKKAMSRPKAKAKAKARKIRVSTKAAEKVSSDVAKISIIAGENFYDIAQVKAKGREENLMKAIEAHNRALSFYTLKDHPNDYAMTQNNLGNAYRCLAGVKDKEKNLELAMKAFHEALRVHTRDAFPINYAGIRFNLGHLYLAMAGMYSKKGNKGQEKKSLKQAEVAFAESLKLFRKERITEWIEEATKHLAAVRRFINQIKD
ncbi:MAG: hypothetical protein ACE5KK_01780 [Candidatus Brocadiales bacterium]